jgi:hypothetical protein
MSDRRSRITTEQIERARAVPIENEIARRGIKLRGNLERVGPCPRYGGTDRFGINVRKQAWHCRGCNPTDIAGDVIGLVMLLDGRSFRQGVELLADDASPHLVAAASEQRRRDDADSAVRIASALRWWGEAGPIKGTATTYLKNTREIAGLPPDMNDVLRFHRRRIWGQDGVGQWRPKPLRCSIISTPLPTFRHQKPAANGARVGPRLRATPPNESPASVVGTRAGRSLSAINHRGHPSTRRKGNRHGHYT